MTDDEMKYQIRNCEIAFKCEAEWDDLDETKEKRIKFCNQCQKQVHLCDTDELLLHAIKSNLCVAIEAPFHKWERPFVGSLRARTIGNEIK